MAEDQAQFDEAPRWQKSCVITQNYARNRGEVHLFQHWLLAAWENTRRCDQQSYADYMRACVLKPLGLETHEVDFVVHDASGHAKGYLGKYRDEPGEGLITDKKVWGQYEATGFM